MKDKKLSSKKFQELMEEKLGEESSNDQISSQRQWLSISDVMIKDVATISADSTIFFAAKHMFEKRVSCVIALEKGKVVGILTETDFLKRIAAKKHDFTHITIDKVMTSPVISIPSDTSVLEAGTIAEVNHVKKLPVVDNEKLVGIVTQTDLIRVLTSYGMWRDIEEIMNSDVVTIDSGATVVEAAEAMTKKSLSCIIVLEDGEVAGIFTERDALKRVVAAQKDPFTTKIHDVMSSPVRSIPPDYSVFSASRLIENTHIRRLVVMDEKKLMGIVTQTDIFVAVKNKLMSEDAKYHELIEKLQAVPAGSA
jgi:CBS domain-containing protein